MGAAFLEFLGAAFFRFRCFADSWGCVFAALYLDFRSLGCVMACKYRPIFFQLEPQMLSRLEECMLGSYLDYKEDSLNYNQALAGRFNTPFPYLVA